MVRIGHKLSSEEHGPTALVEYATMTERSGFDYASVSDHYHPWVTAQGESPHVWTALGGIATATDVLPVWTGVTCPTIRIHPAIIAQAAATTAAMFDGRFTLGLGTGENLSEHILGNRWPPHAVRLEMLEEAVAVMRSLWTGTNVIHHGRHYTVENARLFTLPDEPPTIAIAADGPRTARAAGRLDAGLITVSPDPELVDAYESTASDPGPVYGETTVCWAEDEAAAVETAHEVWPQTALPGDLTWDLPTPAHFEQATSEVSPEDVAASVACGPDPETHLEQIEPYLEAGFDHVTVHQVGPDQEGFLSFYGEEVLPAVR